jgi:hypothetical protein
MYLLTDIPQLIITAIFITLFINRNLSTFHWCARLSVQQTEIINLLMSDLKFYRRLLGSVLLEFDQYVGSHNISPFNRNKNLKRTSLRH